MAPLKGTQLSVMVSVPTYEIRNPPQPGEAIATDSGTATVTRTEPAGNETIWWADYGSGIEQPHIAEGIKQPVPQGAIAYIAPSGWIATLTGQMLNPRYFEPTAAPKPRSRRHSPKGKASGCIKERVGNKNRKRPTISYFYEWYVGGKTRQQYIPVRHRATVQQMINQRQSVENILKFLAHDPNPKSEQLGCRQRTDRGRPMPHL